MTSKNSFTFSSTRRAFYRLIFLFILIFYTTFFVTTTALSITNSNQLSVNVTGSKRIGGNITLNCSVGEDSTDDDYTKTKLWWDTPQMLGYKNITSDIGAKSIHFDIPDVSLESFQNYTCFYTNISSQQNMLNYTYTLEFNVSPQVKVQSGLINVKEFESTQLKCNVTGFPLNQEIQWSHNNQILLNSSEVEIVKEIINLTQRSSILKIYNTSHAFNGSYYCLYENHSDETSIRVQSPPEFKWGVIKAVGKSQIFLNWTIFDGNSPITSMKLKYKVKDEDKIYEVDLDYRNKSIVLKDLSMSTYYEDFVIETSNSIDQTITTYLQFVGQTLSEDPIFIPKLDIKGFTSNTGTLGWTLPDNELIEYYHSYNVSARSKGGKVVSYTSRENPYMIMNLEPGQDYYFKVQACSDYLKSCDPPSDEVHGKTMDGIPTKPTNLVVSCHSDNVTQEQIVIVTWDLPEKPRGTILEYVVSLTGHATYLDEHGRDTEEKIGPHNQTILVSRPRKHEYYSQPPNTIIEISVCAKTRTRVCGDASKSQCTTLPIIPDKNRLSQASWKPVLQKNSNNSNIFFLVDLPSLSQRNGSICCFRVIVYRIGESESIDKLKLKRPDELKILTYDQVHNSTAGGAYIAEMIDTTIHKRRITIGDEKQTSSDKHFPCRKCYPGSEPIIQGSSGLFRKTSHFSTNEISETKKHHKRHASSINQPAMGEVFDGLLDSRSIYTGYLEVIVLGDKQAQLRAQSEYFPPLRPVRQIDYEKPIGFAIIGTLVVALMVVLFALVCVLRWRRKEPNEQDDGLSNSLQTWCRRLRGQHRIPTDEPPIMPSIAREDLASAFLERHKDSDYIFQQEFESLPDRFPDRTSYATDSRDNAGKNRYPDIKAYDQTRIKLSPIEGIPGSDYINANLVVGYKKRKSFICAQGPMESTVMDWWRLVWEQHIHLIIMLTNIEEYNKTKCAKYWPSEGSNAYSDIGITVTHVSEKRYSDYLVRNLKISKTRTNGPGEEERQVIQYHYLVWKDFMAPEHPVGILRFIKRFNEVYSPEKGPILIHCSAGVGRTGTLVALDSLLQQLAEESRVSIFNTICELRHERNYLVQSLKQYIFVYRTLLEMALYDDTEILASDIKTYLEKMKLVPEDKDICHLEEEFKKLCQPQVIEERKPLSVGTSDENKHRNRLENVIPYDRSRVILSPVPGPNKEVCTYINASFIEGYDNTDQFIIAQDPLDHTLGDFWRMVTEQNIRCIVMLSEVGDDKCPRYWPEKDQETSHDFIKVKYMQCQSFPHYYKREFSVSNTKTDDTSLVTQFQYNGWPVGDGEVPESTRGIVELVETTFKFKESLEKNTAPILVHCSAGADRSCIFVPLAILAQQVINESRVDIFSVVRKLKSQRQGLFQNFGQYEFIYRGLITYWLLATNLSTENIVANGNGNHPL